MFTTLFFSSLVVAGVALLWRNFRYDNENPANIYINRLNYWLRKPITCGLCFTYWVALVFVIFFNPLMGWLPPLRFELGSLQSPFVFGVSWMVVGTGAAFVVYFLDTFFEVSHYYAHQAHKKD